MPNRPTAAFLLALLASLLGCGALSAAAPDLFADHIAPLLGQRSQRLSQPHEEARRTGPDDA